MNRSLSLEIVLNLAAREAMAGDFAEIGPEHLFMGLLRLPEVDLSSLRNAFSGEPKVEDLEGEIQEVLAFLGKRGLDFTSLRREIRKAMGRGKTVFKGGAIHRSPESRRLFALAEARCSLALRRVSPFQPAGRGASRTSRKSASQTVV